MRLISVFCLTIICIFVSACSVRHIPADQPLVEHESVDHADTIHYFNDTPTSPDHAEEIWRMSHYYQIPPNISPPPKDRYRSDPKPIRRSSSTTKPIEDRTRQRRSAMRQTTPKPPRETLKKRRRSSEDQKDQKAEDESEDREKNKKRIEKRKRP